MAAVSLSTLNAYNKQSGILKPTSSFVRPDVLDDNLTREQQISQNDKITISDKAKELLNKDEKQPEINKSMNALFG